jgi:hypothetical protein
MSGLRTTVIMSASCQTKAGEVQLKVPEASAADTFETAIIERYQRKSARRPSSFFTVWVRIPTVKAALPTLGGCGLITRAKLRLR